MHAPAVLHLDEVHGLDAVLALVAAVCGLTGLVLVGLEAHRAGMAFGAVGVVAGLWGQMVSRTRSERFADVVGLVASALAFALGAALGGLAFNG
jgi:hypothetical protein